MGYHITTVPIVFACALTDLAGEVNTVVPGLSQTDSSFAALLWLLACGPP